LEEPNHANKYYKRKVSLTPPLLLHKKRKSEKPHPHENRLPETRKKKKRKTETRKISPKESVIYQ